MERLKQVSRKIGVNERERVIESVCVYECLRECARERWLMLKLGDIAKYSASNRAETRYGLSL